MFSEYVTCPTPDIPPLEQLPSDHDGLRRAMSDLYFTQESISRVAYYIWERDGRQNGEDLAVDHGWRVPAHWKLRDAHWFKAKLMLDVVLDTDIGTVLTYRIAWGI